MANMNKAKLIREYAKKNSLLTAREIASDLDMSLPYVHQVLWNDKRRAEAKKVKPKVEAVKVPKEWEEDAEQMAQAVKEDSSWNLKNTQLHIELAKARIIIKYLEERVEELSVRR